jgi:HD-GYP domain-containing protein (c-di-GMP phosphodiesterase class II)
VKFIPVRLGTLRPGDTLHFDVFVKVADRYIRHTLRSDSLDQDRWRTLKEKGVRKVFIGAEAESNYMRYLDEGIDQLKNGKAPAASKAELAQATLINLAEDAKNLDTVQQYSTTGARVGKISEFLTSDKNMAKDFLKTSGVSKDIAQHSATVVTLSLGLAMKVGLTNPKDLMELGMAALLHDSVKEAPHDWALPKENYAPEQKAIHLSHPDKAADTLATKSFVSPLVVELVRHHEEIGNGAGFPGKKNLESLPPLQQVLNLCNHYDSVCTTRNVSPVEAGRQFFIDKVGLFRLDLMTALSEIVNAK